MYFLKPAGGKVEVDTVGNTGRPTPARTTPMPAALALASPAGGELTVAVVISIR